MKTMDFFSLLREKEKERKTREHSEKKKDTEEVTEADEKKEEKMGRRKRVSTVFNALDDILVLTSSFDSTFVWCMNNRLISPLPDCAKCSYQMVISKTAGDYNDTRKYVCNKCKFSLPIRYKSFTDDFNCTLMELIRIIFYYYVRGYGVDMVFREIASHLYSGGGGVDLCKQMIHGIYGFMREVISDKVIQDLKKKKLGGPGVEVWMDMYKLNLRTNSGVDEFWILGFIEKESSRARAYLLGDAKVETVAEFIGKTIAKHSTLCTPYYH